MIRACSRRAAAILAVSLVPAWAAFGAEPSKYDRFFDRVRPLLQARCVSCHGADKQEGGLRLDSAASLRDGGDNGPALRPGDPDASLLVRAVRHHGDAPKMPPKERLKADEVAELAAWVRDGATFPPDAQVLVEDDPAIDAALAEGTGSARLDPVDRAGGASALIVRGQRFAAGVAGWSFPIRETPGPDQYRYLRFAWKKRGGGGIMFEAARDGGWRSQGETNASWVAGPNSTGWPALRVADESPNGWEVVTRDLWQDGGDWRDWSLTGFTLTAIDGGEAGLDSVILGPTVESLDAYAPGRGLPAFRPTREAARVGDARSDPRNPIRAIFRGERLDLWSLRKPGRPALPAVLDRSWPKTPVDRFVLARLEAAGLRPSAEADRRTLIRRLTFDLTGLPPTPGEVEAFLGDARPDAYERTVDRLLASPRHGERWGRSWLDVVRYADTNGFERDEFRPNMWRYRDYVVAALNADKPFDRFIAEQLAGDELAPGPIQTPADADAHAATGFLRLGTFDSTTALFTEDRKGRDELMADLANTTSAAFLGLTMSCCQCHDHKYDPLSQADHFRFRAFFAATKPEDDAVLDLPAERAAIDRHNADVDRRIKEAGSTRKAVLDPARRKLADAKKAALPAEIRALFNVPREKRDAAAQEKLKPFRDSIQVKEEDVLAALSPEDRGRAEALAADSEALKGTRRPLATARVMTDAGRAAPPTNLFFQGDYTQPRAEVDPGFPSALDPNPAAIPPGADETTGRRLALARWIAAADNPWTARVIVNRIWQGYFGRGLVATPNDFGFAGARPSHPELLDWLAVELVDRGWSLKAMHRLIVTGAAYRQGGADDPARRRVDPENRLLWRQEVRRLDAEGLRDALLAVSGRLLPVASGPPRWPVVEEQVLESQPAIYEARHGGDGGRLQDWYADKPEAADVRSVFLIQKRSVPVPLLAPFDLPDTTTSCARRSTTTVAPQALTLLNNPDSIRLAVAFADRVAQAAGPEPAARVALAFRLALAREPDADERAMACELLDRHARLHAADPRPGHRALVDLCRAILNLNEFLFLD